VSARGQLAHMLTNRQALLPVLPAEQRTLRGRAQCLRPRPRPPRCAAAALRRSLSHSRRRACFFFAMGTPGLQQMRLLVAAAECHAVHSRQLLWGHGRCCCAAPWQLLPEGMALPCAARALNKRGRGQAAKSASASRSMRAFEAGVARR
jgi:hypothetical protein